LNKRKEKDFSLKIKAQIIILNKSNKVYL